MKKYPKNRKNKKSTFRGFWFKKQKQKIKTRKKIFTTPAFCECVCVTVCEGGADW